MAAFADRMHDLLIVGTGPAGTSCALQAARDGVDLVLVGDEPVGGLLPAARRVDNLGGLPGVSGRALARRLARHLADFGVVARRGVVARLVRSNGSFQATLDDGTQIAARTVCLAPGTRPRPWPQAGGRDVPRDVRGWPADLRGSRVAVIGGGEAALDSALTARDRGADVVVLIRGAAPRATTRLLEEARQLGVKLRCGVDVAGLEGRPGAWTIETTGGWRLHVDWLAVCVGRQPRRELLDALGVRYLPETIEVPDAAGLFCAGDLIRGRQRYVATALGDGQRAAIAAREFLESCGAAAGGAGARPTLRPRKGRKR